MFDDKNFQVGDVVSLLNWETLEDFGEAKLIDVYEKKFGEVTEEDFHGHGPYKNREEMFTEYRMYYGDKVNEDTLVKIITFSLI